MLLEKALKEATVFFVNDILGAKADLFQSCALGSAWAASIAIKGDKECKITIYIADKSLTKMALLFLNEENPDMETKADLIKEITNLIVGKAKVVAQSEGMMFDIGTPTFEGDQKRVCHLADKSINFLFEDEVFTITAHKASQ